MLNKNKDTFAKLLQELKEKSIETAKPVDNISERKYFLIVSEGERTEPNYFNYFKKFLPKNLVETIDVHGEGDNTLNIVKKAINLKKIRENNVLLPNFDEVWAVFDKDDFPDKRYNEAIKFAGLNNVESGHSNQSFELWYVLHFQFLQNALHREDYIKILSKKINRKYKKNDLKVIDILFAKGNVRRAINWAKALDNIKTTPAKTCPHTRVHILVERLLEYCKIF